MPDSQGVVGSGARQLENRRILTDAENLLFVLKLAIIVQSDIVNADNIAKCNITNQYNMEVF